jgi:hypothetical protein
MRQECHLFLRLVIYLFVLSSVLCAQVERGTVTGLVTDSTGAVVVGAKITIRNVNTNVETRTQSNSTGIYYLPSLPPGEYELRVEQTGFKPEVISNIPLLANLTATYNVTFQLGEVNQAVTVQATAVTLESQTTAISNVLQNREVAELPDLSRNPLQLAAIAVGAQPTGGAITNTSSQAPMQSNPATVVRLSGGTASQNEVLTDGGESRAFHASTASVIPLESIAEFRLDMAAYSSEFGRSGGGVFNIVTKSGTNEFHGVGYEFLQNNHLNANLWQNDRTAVVKGLFQQNQFGAAVGGPIQKSKLFFFFNYEGLRQGSAIQSLNTVPTAAQDSGDFSHTSATTGALDVIYDPNTTGADPANPGNAVRSPFPGNVIPSSRINPISQAVLPYWPAPNRPGQGPTQFNNYFVTGKAISKSDAYLGRVDYYISQSERLFGRFNAQQVLSQSVGLPAQDVALVSRNITTSPVRNGLIALTSTFSPTLLGEFRLAYIRLQSNSVWDGKGFDIASLGFPASVTNYIKNIEYNTFPNISVSQYTVGTGLSVTVGSSQEVSSLSGGNHSVTPTDNWQMQYDLTWMHGRHKVRYGAQVELLMLTSYATNSPAGAYFFDRRYTEGPNPLLQSPTGGNGFASFLLGIPISDRISDDIHIKPTARYYGFYAQDDIQVTRKLTMNVGLRYEYQTPYWDKYGSFGYFSFQGTEPVTGMPGIFAHTAPGAYLTNPQKHGFGPRVGLAYTITPKTVIRTAGAVFYAPTDTQNPGTSDWGNGLFTLDDGTLGAPSPYANTPPPGGSWSNPFASGIVLGSNTETFPGQNVRTYNKYHPFPYVADWTFGIQHELTPTIMVEAAYVGSKVTHLAQNLFGNQVNPVYLSYGSQLLTQVPNPFYGKITDGALSYPTVAFNQLLRPFPQYQQLLLVRQDSGDMEYQSVQFKIVKRFSHGLTVTAGYTISKNMTDDFESGVTEVGPNNALYNNHFNHTIDTNDIPRRFVAAWMYELPIGPGKAHLRSGPLSKILGAWQWNSIATVQKGVPLKIVGSDNTGLPDFSLNAGRANRICNPVLSQPTTNQYFNTSCFANAAPFTMPNDSETQPQLRDYGRANLDMSLFRKQVIKERYAVQLRIEAFNIFNHPMLSLGPGSSVTVSSAQFGQVLEGINPRQLQLGLRLMF